MQFQRGRAHEGGREDAWGRLLGEDPLGGATVSGSPVAPGSTGQNPSRWRCPRALGTRVQSYQSDRQGVKAVSSGIPAHPLDTTERWKLLVTSPSGITGGSALFAGGQAGAVLEGCFITHVTDLGKGVPWPAPLQPSVGQVGKGRVSHPAARGQCGSDRPGRVESPSAMSRCPSPTPTFSSSVAKKGQFLT